MSIKQKNIALLAGFISVLILGYWLSISVSISFIDNYNNLERQKNTFANIPKRLDILERKEAYYDSLLNHYQIAETSIQNNLLKTIDRYAVSHDLKKVSFSEPHQSKQGELNILSYAFSVEGDFQSIHGLAYHLEQENKFGMIASLTFEKLKSYRTGKTSLQGHFILQIVR